MQWQSVCAACEPVPRTPLTALQFTPLHLTVPRSACLLPSVQAREHISKLGALKHTHNYAKIESLEVSERGGEGGREGGVHLFSCMPTR